MSSRDRDHERCKGLTKEGVRCGVAVDHHNNPRSRTIKTHGFCTAHLKQQGEARPDNDNQLMWDAAGHLVRLGPVGPHPHIVQAARRGDLGEVRKILDGSGGGAQLNAARERRARDKAGKLETLMDETPLIAAVRGCRADVVRELLRRGADAKRGCCRPADVETICSAVAWAPGVHETALQVAEDKRADLLQRPAASSSSASTTSENSAKIDRFMIIKEMLLVALQFPPIRSGSASSAAPNPKKPGIPPIPDNIKEVPGLEPAENERRVEGRKKLKEAYMKKLDEFEKLYPHAGPLERAFRGKAGTSGGAAANLKRPAVQPQGVLGGGPGLKREK